MDDTNTIDDGLTGGVGGEDGGSSGNGAAGNASFGDSGALQTDLELANEQIKQLTETAKYALADLQNYRKRTEQEKSEFALFANAKIILELLPILDNFNRAFAQVPEEVSKSEWFKGALQIEQQLVGIMRKQGVQEVPSGVGAALDPKVHEAITAGPGAEDVILEEYEKGYMLGERLIRPAKVKVGDGSGK